MISEFISIQKQAWNSFAAFAKSKNTLKYFLSFCFIFLMAYSTILLCNYTYVDDLRRTRFGSRNWDDFGRYINEYLSILIHGDAILNDISPLPQFLAIVILAATCTIITKAFIADDKFSLWYVLPVTILGLSPYFLECISFKFDSVYMALSLLFSVLPLVFINGNYFVYFLSVVVSSIGMCTTYQAASGVFVLCSLFYSFLKWNEGKEWLHCTRLFIMSILPFGIGLLVFKFVIFRTNTVYHYVNSGIVTSDVFSTVLDNLMQYTMLMNEDLILIWKVVALLICSCFVVSATISSKRNKRKALLLSVLVLFFGYILSYGAYIFVLKPSTFPRTMIGLGAYLALVCLGTMVMSGYKIVNRLCTIVMPVMLFLFSLLYGNSLYHQQIYDEYRVNMLLNDLSKMECLDRNRIKNIQLRGNGGFSPVIKDSIENYGVLKRLVPIRIQEGLFYSEVYFLIYSDLLNYFKYVSSIGKSRYSIDDSAMNICIDNSFHTIKVDDNNIVIIIKEQDNNFNK